MPMMPVTLPAVRAPLYSARRADRIARAMAAIPMMVLMMGKKHSRMEAMPRMSARTPVLFAAGPGSCGAGGNAWGAAGAGSGPGRGAAGAGAVDTGAWGAWSAGAPSLAFAGKPLFADTLPTVFQGLLSADVLPGWFMASRLTGYAALRPAGASLFYSSDAGRVCVYGPGPAAAFAACRLARRLDQPNGLRSRVMARRMLMYSSTSSTSNSSITRR